MSEAKETKKAGRWSCLIWFAIAFLIIKSFGVDLAEEDAHAKKHWDLYQAKITDSQVRHKGLESGWEVHYTFEVAFPEEKRSYSKSQSYSRGLDKDEPVTGQFAIGNTLQVYINPKDRSQFHRPLREAGLRWIAIIGGGFFGLIGLSVLFSRKSSAELSKVDGKAADSE
ncbi:MAG: DUF3592 domain-containing protein [Verrucomicrobiae bacterium]|nr:DUF3592 domain-containing protein [Verrucomicrobiae bacterium]NNJ87742.1 DUF3592 domain-containing protein [Akkermansiaceae bacterium]